MSHSVIRLLLTSALSAVLLLAVYTYHLSSLLPTERGASWDAPLEQTVAIAGKIDARESTVVINEFALDSLVHYALLTWREPVNADNYGLVEYAVATGLPHVELALAWRRADDPANFHSLPLDLPPSGRGNALLAAEPEWRGDILELALHVTSNRPGHPATLEQLTLAAGSPAGILASLRDSWLGFTVWNHRSINNFSWGVNRLLPSPQVAAACWAALSIVLLLAWNAVSHKTGLAVLAAAALIPWLAVDALWQKKLWHQVVLTSDIFAGKTMHEKQLADSDEPLYSYANRLKQGVLPKEPARILLLHNSKGHNPARLRMQYYLLPHNIFNYNGLPPRGQENSLDYVLLLGHTPPEDIQARGQRLYLEDRSIAVELVNRDSLGYLFRVIPESGGAAGE